MAAVPIEKLNDVIIALQSAALNYASAVLQDVQRGPGPGGALTANGATLDLEQMAIQYVRKLDEEHRKAAEVDYTKIAEEAGEVYGTATSSRPTDSKKSSN